MANTDNLDLKRLDGPKTTKFDYDLYVENNFGKVDAAIGAPPSTLTTAAKTVVPAINELKSNKVDKETGKGLSTNDFDNTYKQKIDTDIPAQLAEKANKVQEAWITPTLLNNWVNSYDLAKSRYFKDQFGVVHLEVSVKRDTAAGIQIMRLPAGYRPSQYVFFSAGSTISTEVVPVYVTPIGDIECGYAYALNVSFSISFKAV